MATFLKSLWSMINHREIKRLELERQKREGYSIEFSGGREPTLDYRDGDKIIKGLVSWERGVCSVALISAAEWKPVKIYSAEGGMPAKEHELAPEEFDRVTRRIREYLTVTGGAGSKGIDFY